mgnify:CR=1 FL=1
MKICYFNLTTSLPARDAVYLSGLRKNGIEIMNCTDNSPGIKKFLNLYKKHCVLKNSYDFMWVGYSGHILVPFARLLSRKKIVFNSLCSLYEGIIISRVRSSRFSLKAAWIWLIDFLAFRCASVSLVESNEQKKWLMKKFFLRDDKLIVALTGVDDSLFFYEPNIAQPTVFTVLFRGGFLPESGIEYAIEAAKILKDEDIRFEILGRGQMENKVRKMLADFDSKNVEWISQKIEQNELHRLMQECHLSLGQLSDHDRLSRTIPHKAFESLVMKIPYLTARNKGVLELLTENETCFCCNPADARDLASKILEIKNNPALAARIADNAYKLYNEELTPKILAKKVLGVL